MDLSESDRGVEEPAVADHQADVRGIAARGRVEEYEVSRAQVVPGGGGSDAVLLSGDPGELDTVLRVDVVREAAAVESGWRRAAESAVGATGTGWGTGPSRTAHEALANAIAASSPVRDRAIP